MLKNGKWDWFALAIILGVIAGLFAPMLCSPVEGGNPWDVEDGYTKHWITGLSPGMKYIIAGAEADSMLIDSLVVDDGGVINYVAPGGYTWFRVSDEGFPDHLIATFPPPPEWIGMRLVWFIYPESPCDSSEDMLASGEILEAGDLVTVNLTPIQDMQFYFVLSEPLSFGSRSWRVERNP